MDVCACIYIIVLSQLEHSCSLNSLLLLFSLQLYFVTAQITFSLDKNKVWIKNTNEQSHSKDINADCSIKLSGLAYSNDLDDVLNCAALLYKKDLCY